MSSILITGASKGIGRATAVEVAPRGLRVVGHWAGSAQLG
jgi:NAD(P)-dependent dehydrogenase (short-subunit alcohol dehydrogenase family)